MSFRHEKMKKRVEESKHLKHHRACLSVPSRPALMWVKLFWFRASKPIYTAAPDVYSV